MGLRVTDKKFYYENNNASDFATNTSDYTDYLKPCVGEYVKTTFDFELTNWIEVDTDNGYTFIITNISGTDYKVEITGGGGWTDYKDGYTFDIYNNTGSVLVVTTGTVDYIDNNILYFSSSTVTVGTYTDATAKTKHLYTDFAFRFRLFGDDYKSQIDGSIHKYKGTIGDPQSLTLVELDALGSGAWQTGSFKIKYVSTPDSGYTQLFTFEHIFKVLPFFEAGQIADITNVNIVDLFLDGTIKYDFILKSWNKDNVSKKYVNEFSSIGDVTWYNSAQDSIPTSYSTTSIVYTDTVTSEVLTKITTEKKVNCVVVITDDGGAPFVASDPVTLKHSFLPENYTDSTTDLFDTIWMNEHLRTTLGASTTSGTIITDFTAVRTSATVLTLDFDIEFSAAQKLILQAGYNYLLSIFLEDSTLTSATTNRTNLIIDVNNYSVNTDVDGIVSESSSLYYKHHIDIGSGGTTDYDGTIEDGVVGVITFDLEHSVYAPILNSLSFLVIAYDTVNDTWFEVQRNDIGIAQNVFVTSGSYELQQIEKDTTRGFSLKSGNQFNTVKIETGTLSGSSQPYTLTYAFKINWEDFEALVSANTVFYNAALPNNGLNKNTSNYSGASNYEIRFAREYIYEANGVQTTKMIMSPNSDINDYDESDTSWTVSIDTENAVSFDLEDNFLANDDTTIVATFSDSTTQTSASDFRAIILAKEKDTSNFFEISTYRDVLTGGILKPITGTTASKSIVSGDVEVRCLMDYKYINNPNYSISARIYKYTFPNIYSMLFDGVNETVDFGASADLNFEWTDPFSISFWMKKTDSVTREFLSRRITQGWSVRLEASDALQFHFQASGKWMVNGMRPLGGFVNGQWHHVVLRWDGSGVNSGMTCYVDGVKTLSDTHVLPQTFTGGDSSLVTVNTIMGTRSAAASFYKGNVDEIVMIDKEVSASEVTELYNSGCPNNISSFSAVGNVLSWWRFGDDATWGGSNWTIPDVIGTNTGTSSNMEEADVETDTPC